MKVQTHISLIGHIGCMYTLCWILYRIVTIILGLAQVRDSGIWRQKNQFRLP